MKKICTIILSIAAHTLLQGQGLPNTQIYSLSLKANETKVLIDDLTYLTGFNPEGYNNQPHFIDDDHLLITSDYKSLGLTDILELDTRLNRIKRITHTEESEYSPTVMSSGFDFSVVRQELDDSQPVPQLLWSYPLDRSGSGERIIPDLQNIGYHTWIGSSRVALFLVEEVPQLVLYDISRQTSTRVATDVGRAIKTFGSGEILYIQHGAEGHTIMSYDIYLGTAKKIAPMIEGQRDFEVLPNGHLLAADGSVLKTWIPSSSTSWTVVKDLSGAGIGSITRIASSRNKIAIVTAQ